MTLKTLNPEGRPLVSEKRCPACRETKPATEFHSSKDRYDGLKQFCKICERAKARARILTPESLERRRTQNRAYRCKPEAQQKRRQWKQNPDYQEKQRQYRIENREALLKRQREYRATKEGKTQRREYGKLRYTDPAHNAKWRDRYYQREYGITLQQYDAMLKAQGGVCAICRRPPGKTRLAVDHDHADGETIRGLLCWACNWILGSWKDSPETAQRALDYLLRHRQLRLVV